MFHSSRQVRKCPTQSLLFFTNVRRPPPPSVSTETVSTELHPRLTLGRSRMSCDMSTSRGGRRFGRSSFVAGKWGDLFFGSFPVKFPGDEDAENICLYTPCVLHRAGGRDNERCHHTGGHQLCDDREGRSPTPEVAFRTSPGPAWRRPPAVTRLPGHQVINDQLVQFVRGPTETPPQQSSSHRGTSFPRQQVLCKSD